MSECTSIQLNYSKYDTTTIGNCGGPTGCLALRRAVATRRLSPSMVAAQLLHKKKDGATLMMVGSVDNYYMLYRN